MPRIRESKEMLQTGKHKAKPFLIALALWTVTSLLIAGPQKVRLFRSADESATIRIFAPDKLELITKEGPGVHRYSHEGAYLRVVVTRLGRVDVLNFKKVSIGLIAPDGTVLYDEEHFHRR